ncbi:sigma-70 family RNA polymerase sigma factor [Dethiobacter alkaliphilus]|uniref:RNA polymerase sigma factor n=1 Tax=Dethiobacter alkaliphilus AHT 1 TaxID=555088 RepID=C0GJF8_DETAL|nr:RNA polymerase sigma factor FliA [Dethiobacter alkaliphilus]EEG76505.1 RNA polymerase, sigma 28 subunit, FliA/WhiG [Dethiobacter alkaliphilus AHT 1]
MSGANVWVKYQETKEEGLQETLVEKYLPLVRLHAGRLALGLPAHVNRDDLLQAGMLGLLEALQRFDPTRGVKFESFAALRIRGAMLDELRRLCWVPRSVVREMREMDRAVQELATQLGREPAEEEIAEKMGITIPQLRKITGMINSSSLLSLEDTLLAVPAVDGPEVEALDRLIAAEDRQRLAEAIGQLPERHQQLLALYYQEDLTLKEVGLVLGVTESRVCQLHARIIARLRTALQDE